MSSRLHSPHLASKEASNWGKDVDILILTKYGQVPNITPQETATYFWQIRSLGFIRDPSLYPLLNITCTSNKPPRRAKKGYMRYS